MYDLRAASIILVCSVAFVALTGCLTNTEYSAVSKPNTTESASAPAVSAGASAIEDSTLVLINTQRTKKGLAPLPMRSDLLKLARAHSQDMATRDFHAHTNPDGESPWDRMREAGITYSSSAENIAWNNHADQAAVAVDNWMESWGHRENILNGDFTHTGIGVAMDSSGGAYFTQVFIRE